MARKIRIIDEGEAEIELNVPLESVCFVIAKARQLDVKDAVTEPNAGSNPTDDGQAAVLEDHGNDPVLEEIYRLVTALPEDGQIDLVALMWLGRDDSIAADWPSLREQAAAEHNERTARYLCGTPLLADYLAEGLSVLNYSCTAFEAERL